MFRMTKARRLLLHLLLGLSTGNAQGPDQQGKATQKQLSFTILLYVLMTVQDTRYMYLDRHTYTALNSLLLFQGRLGLKILSAI